MDMKLPKLAPQLYLDSDGVVLDFAKLAFEILGMTFEEYEEVYGVGRLWRILEQWRSPKGLGFFESLELMPDAMELYNSVKHLKPIILTGAPAGKWAPPQKIRAHARYFPGVKVIVCLSKDKIAHLEDPGDVLVDDTLKYRHLWENGGGTFVHHTSAKQSIAELREICPLWFQHTDRWSPPKAA